MNNQLLEYKKMIDLRDLFHGLQNQMLASLNVNRNLLNIPAAKVMLRSNIGLSFYEPIFLTDIKWIRL